MSSQYTGDRLTTQSLSEYPDDSFVIRALSAGIALIVGGGYVACNVVNELISAAERAGIEIKILWVAEQWDGHIASFGSGGWHFPFLTDDPRIPGWARASFRNHPVLNRLGLQGYLHDTQSVILTRDRQFKMPPGAPGPVQEVDPREYGAGFYDHAHRFTTTVLSMCTALPQIHKGLARIPSVVRLTHHFETLADVLRMARQEDISTVLVAAGAGASDLLGHTDVDADFGMLLLAPTSTVPEALRGIVFMDEDSNQELTYGIPHVPCGHTAFGGVTGWRLTEEDLRADNGYRQELARGIRDRLITRLPSLRSTLSDDSRYRIWWGWRPVGSKAIARWLPPDATDGINVMELGALSGSGITVAPGFVAEAMRLRASVRG